MPDIAAAEVVSHAMVKESIPTLPLSIEQRMARDAAEKVEQDGYREAIKFLKEPRISWNQAQQRIDEIGITYDGATGEKSRTPEEQQRFSLAQKDIKILQKLLEGKAGTGNTYKAGFEGLETREQDQLTEIVLQEASKSPYLKERIDSLRASGQEREYAERLLRDPNFALKLRESLEETLQEEIPDVVSQKKEDYQEAQIEFDQKDSELTDINRSLAAVKTQLLAFKRDESTGLSEGNATKAARLEELRGMRLEAAKQTLERQLPFIEQKLQRLEQERRSTPSNSSRSTEDIDADIDALKKDISRLQEEVLAEGRSSAQVTVLGRQEQSKSAEMGDLRRERAAAQKKTGRDAETIADDITQDTENLKKLREALLSTDSSLEELKALESEEQQLEKRHTELVQQQREKEAEKKRAELKRDKALRELEDAKRLRASYEQHFVDRLHNTYAEATDAYLNAQLEKIDRESTKLIAELKQETTDENEKKALSGLEQRYYKEESKRFGGKKRVIDKATVNTDYSDVLLNGPQGRMREILHDSGIPYDEVDDMLKDKNFVDKFQPAMIKQILSKKVRIGGVTKEDIDLIQNSSWGNGMLQEAYNSNTQLRQAIEQAVGQGALDTGRMRKFWDEAKKHPSLILLLLGTVAAAGAVAVGGPTVFAAAAGSLK